VFDLFDTEKLKSWREFRLSLETSATPFQDVALLWSKAPFVNRYLNPHNPNSWPDPWKLIMDGKFDDLAICLGMCYTLQLTERFTSDKFEIHMSILPEGDQYMLVVNDREVLNLEPRTVLSTTDLPENSIKIWSN
jgi:hypothetical protein